jgi:outer membrane murein-binding lipoprotein Lpp
MDQLTGTIIAAAVPTLAVIAGFVRNEAVVASVNHRIETLTRDMNANFETVDNRMNASFEAVTTASKRSPGI